MIALVLAFWLLGAQDAAPMPDGLAAAKALYVSADYEAALAALASIARGEAVDEADQYRALCLLALDRVEEAEGVLQSLIARNPSFRVSEADVSPRLVVLFQRVRRRAIPAITRERYLAARADFDRANYEQAAAGFRALLSLLATERAAADDAATVTDLQIPAEGFLKLAEAAVPIRRASAEQEAIDQVVRRYAQAYVALDADAVVRLLGHADRRSLQAAFDGLKSQTVETRDVRIATNSGGDSAIVTLTWAVDAVPKVGRPRQTRTPTTLRLVKSAAGEWTIADRR